MAPIPDGTPGSTPEGTPDPLEGPPEASPLDSTAPDTVENPEPPERPTPEPGEVPEVFQHDTVDAPVRAPKPPLSLDFYAVSDVGRVRKDNQDSGYAGPWLLSVCTLVTRLDNAVVHLSLAYGPRKFATRRTALEAIARDLLAELARRRG
jgi:hypothetical protein